MSLQLSSWLYSICSSVLERNLAPSFQISNSSLVVIPLFSNCTEAHLVQSVSPDGVNPSLVLLFIRSILHNRKLMVRRRQESVSLVGQQRLARCCNKLVFRVKTYLLLLDGRHDPFSLLRVGCPSYWHFIFLIQVLSGATIQFRGCKVKGFISVGIAAFTRQ